MCRKTPYPSQKQAVTQMHLFRRRAAGRCPKRAYYCPECQQFHLTSQTFKPHHSMTLRTRIQNELTGIKKDLANPKFEDQHPLLAAQKRVLEHVLKPEGKK